MGNLVRIVVDDHVCPTELLQEVTVDIDRVFSVSTQAVSLAYSSRIIAIEVQVSTDVSILCSPVVYVETEVASIRNDQRIKGYMIPSVRTSRVYITVLPVERHRVRTLVTGNLRHVKTYLQVLIGLDTYITCDRITGNILTQHLIDEVGLECRYIEVTMSQFLNSLIDQFAQRFGTSMEAAALVDSTFANRHLAIHFVLQRSSSFNSSCTVQLISEGASVCINVVIADIRDTNHIPVLLVVTRNNVIHVRNNERCLSLVRINSLRSIRTCESRAEYERVSSTNLDIEFYITERVNSLSRNIMGLAITLSDGTLTVVLQSELFQHICLREQTFVN